MWGLGFSQWWLWKSSDNVLECEVLWLGTVRVTVTTLVRELVHTVQCRHYLVQSGRKDFSLLLSAHNGSGTRRASYSVGTWVIPRGKAAEATHHHLVRRLRMDLSPLPPVRLHGLHMDYLIFDHSFATSLLSIYRDGNIALVTFVTAYQTTRRQVPEGYNLL